MPALISALILLFSNFLAPIAPAADLASASAAYRNQQYTEAFSQFRELAEGGDPRMQTILAIMYKYGEGVPVDPVSAFEWYLKAAHQGYPPAQFNVGYMLAQGVDVDEDRVQAVQWLEKAASSGHQRAKEHLRLLTRTQHSSTAGTGPGSVPAPAHSGPVTWSRNWNLRLPNEIRYHDHAEVDLAIRVYRVQLGAMHSLAAAEALWQKLQALNPSFFEPYQPTFSRAESSETGAAVRTVFRLQIGPFDNAASAGSFCEAFTSQAEDTAGCLVLFTY
jgi:TPR repeat protein